MGARLENLLHLLASCFARKWMARSLSSRRRKASYQARPSITGITASVIKRLAEHAVKHHVVRNTT